MISIIYRFCVHVCIYLYSTSVPLSWLAHMTDPKDPFKLTEDTRPLGLVVCRGTAVVLVCPSDSMEVIPNPFLHQEPS